ncbi:glycoside hydrolase family 16 protein [Actinoplanes sp. NPDC004185]
MSSPPAVNDSHCYLFPVPAGGTWLVTFGVAMRVDQPVSTVEVSVDTTAGHETHVVSTDTRLSRVSVLVPAPAGPLRVSIVERGHRVAVTSAALTLARHDTAPLTSVFSDEFDGIGTAPDDARWRLETGFGTWGNNEQQTYTADPANVQVAADQLAVVARRGLPDTGVRYTSARLNSTYSGTYGRIEGRIRTPGGTGLLPAFWMLGVDARHGGWPACGEIDIMEHLGSREPHTVHASLHGPDLGGTPWKTTMSTGAAAPLADQFHTYAVDWWPGLIQMSVDGTVFATYAPEDLPPGRQWVFDKPFYLLLNVAVGGDWPGEPDATVTFPQTMFVDYVRWLR